MSNTRFAIAALTLIALLALCQQTSAQIFINEIFFDPPGGSGDDRQEYIELRGTPGASLDNHWLLFLENENNSADTGNPSQVEMMFDLSTRSLSPTGFFSLRQKNHPYINVPNDQFNIANTMGMPNEVLRFGTTPGVDNNIGAWSSSLYSDTPGRIENSGFTAMLIRVNPGGAAPTLGMKLDGSVDNDNDPLTIHDGLDYPNGVPDLPNEAPAWSIIDSVGIFSEGTPPGGFGAPGEAIYGRTYAKINYGPEIPGQSYTFFENGQQKTVVFEPNITEGQTYVGLGYEVELIHRWGNSSGDDPRDWHITNVTDNSTSGFTSAADGFRQSGHVHDDPEDDFVETNQFVPYGANLTNTIGAANYPQNLTQLPWDYNKNGVVDAADYVVWRDSLGQGVSPRGTGADGNGSGIVDEDDWIFWANRFGDSVGQFGFGGGRNYEGLTVPEPAGLILAALVLLAAILPRNLRRL